MSCTIRSTEFEQQLKELSQNEFCGWGAGGLINGTSGRRHRHQLQLAEARSSFLRAAPHLRLIAAGGLAPENVKQAIQILRPWGVDVVSGVESAPGKKDPARVLGFHPLSTGSGRRDLSQRKRTFEEAQS